MAEYNSSQQLASSVSTSPGSYHQHNQSLQSQTVETLLEQLRSITSDDNPRSACTMQEEVGSGTLGTVYRGEDIGSSSSQVAIKVVYLTRRKEPLKCIVREISILKGCNHPNIVKFYNSYMLSKDVWLVTEYINGMNVQDIVESSSGLKSMTESNMAAIAQECLCGLAYLHEHRILHRDIKSSNIMISNQGEVKIIDFGFCIVQEEDMFRSGTPDYMAPEMLAGGNYGPGVDIWSMGILMIEMIIGDLPYSHWPLRKLVKFTKDKNQPEIPENTKHNGKVSDTMKSFIKNCLNVEAIDRPTAQTLLKHPFVTSAAPLSQLGTMVTYAAIEKKKKLQI